MKHKEIFFTAGAVILIALLAASPVFGQDAGESPARIPVLDLPDGLEAGFAAELDLGLASMLEESPIARRAVDLVLGQLQSQWLPAEPAEAALMIYAAAHEADVAQRRGVPAPEIKTRIRQEWQAIKQQAHEFTIRRQMRGGGTLEEFLRENRRAFMDSRGNGAGWNDLDHGGKR
jgi:hypothetical protein